MTHHNPILDFGATEPDAVNLVEISERLTAFAARVESGDLGQAEFWRGADVVVIPEYIPVEPGSFYPGDDQLITEHVPEVSWAFYELRDAFESFLASDSKYWFFGTLREAAMLSISIQSPTEVEDPKKTVSFMVAAAEAMLETIRLTEGTA